MAVFGVRRLVAALDALASQRTLEMEHRTGVEPVSQRWQRRVLNQLDQRCGIQKREREDQGMVARLSFGSDRYRYRFR